MGITLAYRGRLADLTRIEDFEDRLLDLALEVGGLAKIWRSHADDDPQRLVRGIILNLAPGQETASLLIAPEGWLIGLTDIEDAERGRLTEPPWCFIKTQFGPLDGHVALVEMFAALRREFLPDLEVRDEGGYWETRDFAELARRHSQVREAIDALAEGLQRHGLSREAAEDPDILLRRIERIAAQVRRVLQRPAEHAPISFPEEGEDFSGAQDLEATEALWDEMFKHNRRQQERLQRTFEEGLSRGENEDLAFEDALDDLGLEAPAEDPEEADEPWRNDEREVFADDVPDDASYGEGDEEDSPFESESDERHPLLERASEVLQNLRTVFGSTDPKLAASLQALFHGAGDAMGGLAQALSGHSYGRDDYGLRASQLKRALRGAAFARGALFPLRSAVSKEQFDDMYRILGQLEEDIFHELGRLRSQHEAGDS